MTAWQDRNGFPGWLMAVVWLFGAFFGFQILAAIIVFVGFSMGGGDILSLTDPAALLSDPNLLFIGNSTGQVLVLGLMTWWLTRLSVATKAERPAFLRFAPVQGGNKTLVLSVLLVFAIQPVILYLGWANQHLPLPQWIKDLDEQQMAMIEQLLRGDIALPVMLFHVALVPAICEEVLFRGYILRQFEKNMGPMAAVILTGVIFGLFHLRLVQAIPLIVLGVLITWLAWRTGSVWTAVVVHFVNNGASVVAAYAIPDIMFDEKLQNTAPPWWAVAIGLGATYYLFLLLRGHLHEHAQRPATH